MRPISLLALAVLLLGCEHADPLEPDVTESTFASIQENIFSQSCALSGCHAGANAQMGMDLSAGAAYDALVGVPSQERPELLRVDPGDPDASYLIHKVEGAAGIVGQRMPLGRSALSSADLTLLREWVAAGAPRD